MKTRNIFRWVFTTLFVLLMLSSAIHDLLASPDVIKTARVLGYPLYFIQLLGVAKFLGVIAILVPGLRRVKDWAYTGFAFDLIGAIYSLYSVPHDPTLGPWYLMIIPVGLYLATYWLNRKPAVANGLPRGFRPELVAML